MTTLPSPEISRRLIGAIHQALREEKMPYGRRLAKVFLASVGCTLILAVPLLMVFRDQMGAAWLFAIGSWWICLFAGFYLHYIPQPRLAVTGFWSPWIFARVLMAMVVLTATEILICPSFVFLRSPLRWSPFEGASQFFMDLGGMPLCMFACGFLFSGLGGVITFALIAKTVRGSSWVDILKATGVAYFTQLPVIGIQLVEPGLQRFVSYWIFGGLLGTFLMAVLVKSVAPLLTSKGVASGSSPAS
jgi:hypothetical protein